MNVTEKDGSGTDAYWMREAIRTAEGGRFIAPPNPAVGCVIVRDGKEISRGFTHRPGSCHAEINAIENAAERGLSVAGATVYVTLEPCSHYGRTPPCALRLIKEKVARVVAATVDPNPLVAGRGLAMLQKAGIAVTRGVCEEEAIESNRAFLCRMTTGRPWVRLKIAMSLDGRTALPNGVSQWITSDEARADARRERAASQGLLTAVGTVLADDPQMSARTEGLPDPKKYVIDPQGKTPVTARILQGAPCTVFVGSGIAQSRKKALEAAGARMVLLPPDGQGHLDLAEILKIIAGDSVNDLFVEAGANLSGKMLAAGLADELLLYVAPRFLGSGRPAAELPELSAIAQSPVWHIRQTELFGGDIKLTLRKRRQSNGSNFSTKDETDYVYRYCSGSGQGARTRKTG